MFEDRLGNRLDDLTDDWRGNLFYDGFDDGFYDRGSDLVDDRFGYVLDEGFSNVAGYGFCDLFDDGFYDRRDDLPDNGLRCALNDGLDGGLRDRDRGFFKYWFDDRRRTFLDYRRCHLFGKWFGDLLREGTKEVAVVGICTGCSNDDDAECCKEPKDQSAQGNGNVIRSITVHVFTSPRVTSIT